MTNTRRFLFRLLTVLLLLGIAALMMVIGRGHTVYLDNKKLEFAGNTYDPPYRVTVFVNGEQVAKLNVRERGAATNIGQSFAMTLRIMQEKGGVETETQYQLKLPYDMDGIVVNLPGFLAGLPEEAWLSEFVPVATESDSAEEEIPDTDEFELGDF